MNVQNVCDIKSNTFFELNIPHLLSDYWLSLADQFSELLHNKEFKYLPTSANQKVVAIWSQLQESTELVPLSQFIEVVERIIPSSSSGFLL